MSRRSSRRSVTDDLAFLIRIKLRVPLYRFGKAPKSTALVSLSIPENAAAYAVLRHGSDR